MDPQSQVIKGMKIYANKPGSNYIIEKLYTGTNNPLAPSQLSQASIVSQDGPSLSRNTSHTKNQGKCLICKKALAKWGVYGCEHLIVCDSLVCKGDPQIKDPLGEDDDFYQCLVCSKTGFLEAAMSQPFI